MKKCAGCGSEETISICEFGKQPISFDFKTENKILGSPIKLIECSHCQLVQLEEGISRFNLDLMPSWIVYNEPEYHLKELVEICDADGVWSEKNEILGLTDHDSPLLSIVGEISKCSIKQPLKGNIPQPWITEEMIDQILIEGQRFDVVVARRILEHFENPNRVLEKLHKFGASRLLIEIPDSRKSLEQGDVSMIWEEHKCYFTSSSLNNLLSATGWSVRSELVWNDIQEDTKIVLAQPGRNDWISNVESIGSKFADKARSIKIGIQSLLSKNSTNAIFGAGHRAVAFLIYHQLEKHIYVAYDDHKMKLGKDFPGTMIKIRPSREFDPNTEICLLAIGPGATEKVKENFGEKYPLTKFLSILPDSRYFGL